MASLGNDNIRQAIQNTVGIANAIRQARAGQPTFFNLPIPQMQKEYKQMEPDSSTQTTKMGKEYKQMEPRFNPASGVPEVVGRIGELDLPGRQGYDPEDELSYWSHAPGTRPSLPSSPVWTNENERRRGNAWQDFIEHNLYNIANGPRQIKETGTVPRSYLSPEAQKRIWPNYSEVPFDARLTPEQWLSGGLSDVYRYLGGGA